VKVEQVIISKLSDNLSPTVLRVLNESHNHSVPANSETHFNVTLVSEVFSGLRQVQRHQKVYQVLAEEMAGPVHALALHTYSPTEWEGSPEVRESPDCAGGSK